jgi:hypothetical protein
LLKENVIKNNVGFEIGGCAGPLPGSGLGVEIDKNKLQKLCESDRITIINPN